jgi:hypothetical protein
MTRPRIGGLRRRGPEPSWPDRRGTHLRFLIVAPVRAADTEERRPSPKS